MKIKIKSNEIILVSACLAGIKCRWDGRAKPSSEIIKLVKQGKIVPVCPEQLGGLPTPREQSEQKEKKVVTKLGKDVTKNFERGAKETLKIAKLVGAEEFIGKSKSPSCGCGQIYDGTFSDKLIKGNGVTAAFLKRNGIKVYSEEDI